MLPYLVLLLFMALLWVVPELVISIAAYRSTECIKPFYLRLLFWGI